MLLQDLARTTQSSVEFEYARRLAHAQEPAVSSCSSPRSSAEALTVCSSAESSESSEPWPSRRTPLPSSERSTSKRYQLSSHITVIATTLGRSGSGRTETPGGPRERATPPTIRTCSDALK